MNAKPKITERERQRRAWQRAMSVRAFCEIYGVGRTKAYEEINAGRLRARKAGRRTIITADDAEDWLGRLPALQEALDEAAS
jgi:Helix-turn-helix domain